MRNLARFPIHEERVGKRDDSGGWSVSLFYPPLSWASVGQDVTGHEQVLAKIWQILDIFLLSV